MDKDKTINRPLSPFKLQQSKERDNYQSPNFYKDFIFLHNYLCSPI